MSQIMVASTTDTPEAVTAAAAHGGATVIQPAEKESAAAPATEEQPETGDESETPTEEEQEGAEASEGEEQGEEDGEEKPEQPKPAKKGGFQRKIDKLTRERHELHGRVEELLRQLDKSSGAEAKTKPPAETAKPAQQPGAKPRQDDFQSYEEYIEAITDWKVDQREQTRTAEERQRQQAEASRQQVSGWQERVGAYRETVDDFDEVLESVQDIQLPQALQQALMDAEDGPKLAYELAKDRKELARIARLSPIAAIRELGKFEAKLSAKSTTAPKPAVSKAPEPIRPVGARATTSTKSPDEMSFQEYKKWRAKNGAR